MLVNPTIQVRSRVRKRKQNSNSQTETNKLHLRNIVVKVQRTWKKKVDITRSIIKFSGMYANVRDEKEEYKWIGNGMVYGFLNKIPKSTSKV